MSAVLIPIGIIALGFLAALALLLRAARAGLVRERAVREEQAERLSELECLTARNTAILQNAMDGFFVLGEDYRFLEVNAAFCRMTGYSEEELPRMRMTDLEVSAPVQESGDSSYWRTGLHHFATAHRHKDGHIIRLESCVVVLREAARKLLVGFTRDVTERYRAEEALRASEVRYRNLVEMSRDLIWSTDLSGRLTFVNNAAQAIFGYEPEEMLGRRVTKFVAPHQRRQFRAILRDIWTGRSRLRFETEHRRKDGLPVQLNVAVSAVHDDNGTVIGYTGTATDISEQKKGEERLRQANARFESLVSGMPLGYIVWSKDFRILEWNPAASSIFGYAAEDVIGQRATELIVPVEGHKAFTKMFQALLDWEPCHCTVLVNQRQDGEKIRCEWFNTALPDSVGGVQGVATMVRDVSERERLETQLRQSQKLESLGVLAGGVAHDFNNLLVGIMGNASLAIEKLPAGSAVRPLLERVVNAGQRSTELTQRMLAYAGRASCDVRIMDLNALVEELTDFASAAIPKSVKLTINTVRNLPLIEADSGQVQQIIMNLLINAAEAIGEASGEVTVSTWAEELDAPALAEHFPQHKLSPGMYVGLEVRDTGCGMSPDILGRVFDPFFTTKFAGRGLGLSAILGIVKAHRGAISFSSRLGVGTVFRVLFPAITSKSKPVAAAGKSKALPRGSTVLVIDDEEDICEVVEAVLESRGIKVLSAEDGRAGIEAFRKNAERVDAVLLDINMPGMSGEAVFRELRVIRPDVRVILSTGYSEQEAASHFADADLAGFVNKPYTASMLVEKIGAALTAEVRSKD
ncbi:MAG: PAS domain S-box protein [Phycisphaerae bacterium]|nr:PAS domain S-box protein [Phycisphaerae bacterium]